MSHRRNGRGRSKTGSNAAKRPHSEKAERLVRTVTLLHPFLSFSFLNIREGKRKESSARKQRVAENQLCVVEKLKTKIQGSQVRKLGVTSSHCGCQSFCSCSGQRSLLQSHPYLPHSIPILVLWDLARFDSTVWRLPLVRRLAQSEVVTLRTNNAAT